MSELQTLFVVICAVWIAEALRYCVPVLVVRLFDAFIAWLDRLERRMAQPTDTKETTP